ncbi:MAG: ABC transporter permease subunit [Gemmatimonadota bacterium]|nr:ABC transporter permease subunit [Gemmatimonadota bacterium]MDH3424146.1 ABC transporter permease subunit [Gemmatimonadota bacterium]
MTGTLFRNELRMVFRDTRTVLIAVVAPLVLFPLFIFITNFVEERESARLDSATYEFAVTGERSAWADDIVRTALNLDTAGLAIAPASFDRVMTQNADSLLEAGDLHVLVVGRDAVPGDSVAADVPVLELRFRASSDFSRNARNRMEERLLAVRTQLRDSVFQAAGFPVALDEVVVFESDNVASAEKEAGSFLGGVLVPFLILLMLSGGSIVAADSISGEKERGTLETLLTTASSRRDIVNAKLGAIMAVGLAVGLVNIANIGVYIGLGILDLPETLRIGIGVDTLLILLLLTIPLVVMVGAALLLLSGVSNSYKEYQIYFLPLFLVFLLPSMAAFLPGVELSSAIAFVPISGLAVATRALLMGDWHWIWGAIALGSTGAAGWLLLQRTEAALSNERLITSAGADEVEFRGGAALFPREVLTWFVGFWVVFFVVSLWFGEALGVRGQVLVNLWVIFLGGSILLIRRYGLDVRETLQLYAPHWRAWPAVIIGAPSALVLAIGLFGLVNRYLFPVPESLLESFGQSLTADISLWQLIIFVTIMPGVLEEIAFRGVLLSGLRKHLKKPWLAVLVSAAIFGVFHVSLFRIVPTAFLGVVLALVVVRTGSIFPAMLWHFLNNFLAVVPQEMGWIVIDQMEGVGTVWYALAVVGATASWLMMANRSGQLPPEPAGRPTKP